MLCLKMLKSDLIDVSRYILSLKNGSIMKSLIPVVPENIACHISKDLKFMTIHKRDAQSVGRRND
jgi:hypothetical protein